MAKRRRRRRKRRSYGQPFKVYSGFGALDVGLDSVLPPLVGGTASMGTNLLLRAFVKPVKLDEAGAPVYETVNGESKVKENVLFKYAGLFGMGAGILASAVLGPFMGWGTTLIGSITSVAVGATAQLHNTVVPKDYKDYRGLGLVALQPRHYGMRYPIYTKGMGAPRGMGAIGVTPVDRKYLKPGRGVQSMPAEVLAASNMSAFGPTIPGMV